MTTQSGRDEDAARPEWVRRINEEGRGMDLESVVPLEPRELLEVAQRNTGLADFGADEWREGYERLLAAIKQEAQLTLLGRLMTRSDILRWLETRLQIEAVLKAHPQIDDEVIDAPVIVTGLGRSGTSIMLELLSQDPQFGSPRCWELEFPCPPPQTATYDTDQRSQRCHPLVTQWHRIAPAAGAMHENRGDLPAECIRGMNRTFKAQMQTVLFQVPTYTAWQEKQDMRPVFAYYKRTLKLLQWKNPRRHWLLKAPAYIDDMPAMFATFPGAQAIFMHRDPIKAHASIVSVLRTQFATRTDQPYDAGANRRLLTFEGVVDVLNKVIDEEQRGQIPREQLRHFKYADLISAPFAAIERLYGQLGLELTPTARARMEAYLRAKPQGRAGKHGYSYGDRAELARKRALLARHDGHYDCPPEV
jgi:hypothetical protein